jgi:predicted nucleic acid-binding Zn ribbon protein
MPTYVYKFIETGETIEVQQSFEDDALTEAVHPERGETMPVKKVFLPVGVTFRGDGFYKTDSRAASKSATKTESKSGAASNGSSDSSGGSSSGSSESSASSSSSSGASSGTAASTSGSSSD